MQRLHQQTRSTNPAIKTIPLSLMYDLIINLISLTFTAGHLSGAHQIAFENHIETGQEIIWLPFCSCKFQWIFIFKATLVLSGVNGCVRCPIMVAVFSGDARSLNRTRISQAGSSLCPSLFIMMFPEIYPSLHFVIKLPQNCWVQQFLLVQANSLSLL